MRFAGKIGLVLAAVGVLPVAILGLASYTMSRDEFRARANAQLAAVALNALCYHIVEGEWPADLASLIGSEGWRGAYQRAASEDLIRRRSQMMGQQLQAMHQYQVTTRTQQILKYAESGDYGPQDSDADLGTAGPGLNAFYAKYQAKYGEKPPAPVS